MDIPKLDPDEHSTVRGRAGFWPQICPPDPSILIAVFLPLQRHHGVDVTCKVQDFKGVILEMSCPWASFGSPGREGL